MTRYVRTENGKVLEETEWDGRSPHPFRDHLFAVPEASDLEMWIGMSEAEMVDRIASGDWIAKPKRGRPKSETKEHK